MDFDPTDGLDLMLVVAVVLGYLAVEDGNASGRIVIGKAQKVDFRAPRSLNNVRNRADAVAIGPVAVERNTKCLKRLHRGKKGLSYQLFPWIANILLLVLDIILILYYSVQ